MEEDWKTFCLQVFTKQSPYDLYNKALNYFGIGG